jgi:hypothetical protein
LAHHVHGAGGTSAGEVFESELQRVPRSLTGAADGCRVSGVGTSVHQHRIHHCPELVFEGFALVHAERLEGTGE